MDIKIKDFQIADDILDIIYEEVQQLKVTKERGPSEIVRLSNLAKAYQIIMASTRENIRSGLLGKLSDEELTEEEENDDEV